MGAYGAETEVWGCVWVYGIAVGESGRLAGVPGGWVRGRGEGLFDEVYGMVFYGAEGAAV